MRDADELHLDPALSEAVRRIYLRPVDGARAVRDVAMLALVAQEEAGALPAARGTGAGIDLPARPAPARPWARRLRLWRPVLVAAAAAVALPAGLAVAGLRLPAPVEAPFEAVGIELPNQAAEGARRPDTVARPTPPVVAPRTAAAPSPAAPGAAASRPAGPDRRSAAGSPTSQARRRGATAIRRPEDGARAPVRRAAPSGPPPASHAAPAGRPSDIDRPAASRGRGGAAPRATRAQPARPATPASPGRPARPATPARPAVPPRTVTPAPPRPSPPSHAAPRARPGDTPAPGRGDRPRPGRP